MPADPPDIARFVLASLGRAIFPRILKRKGLSIAFAGLCWAFWPWRGGPFSCRPSAAPGIYLTVATRDASWLAAADAWALKGADLP